MEFVRRRFGIEADLVPVLAASASWGFAFSVFFLLPKFLATELAATPFEIGLVSGIFGIATVACTPFAGAWVDRFPHRLTIRAGAIVLALDSIAFLAVDAFGPLILALRIVQAVSFTLVFTAMGVAVADLTPPERLSQALGIAGASMLVMNAVGPAVAEPLAATAGWNAVFLLAATTACVSTAFASRIRAARVHDGSSPVRKPGSLVEVLRHPLARHYAVIVTLAGLTFGTLLTFTPPYALAGGREWVGGFFAAFAGTAIIVRTFFGHWPDRFGRRRIALASLTVYTAVMLAMALSSPTLLELLGAAFGLAHGLFYPSLNAVAMMSVRPEERGRVMAIFTGSFNLGLAGTILLGTIAEGSGYRTVFLVATLAAATATVRLATSRPFREEPDLTFTDTLPVEAKEPA